MPLAETPILRINAEAGFKGRSGMQYLPLVVIGILCAAPPVFAADRDEDECEEVKQEIRKVQAKMRRGYSAEQGVELNAKLLELRERRSKVCR
ncbi:MAG TPA: hypothetical protein VHG33_08625 [Woeseiaceae bacterium]|nr:hypothetical protein [Woeseiaceae bacterium]